MKLKKKIKDLDYFGQSIQLNLNGQEQHNTLIGGVNSLFINIFMAAYIIVLFVGMVTFSNDTITTKDIYIDEAVVQLNEMGYVPIFYLYSDITGGVQLNKETQKYIQIKS